MKQAELNKKMKIDEAKDGQGGRKGDEEDGGEQEVATNDIGEAGVEEDAKKDGDEAAVDIGEDNNEKADQAAI